MTEKEIITISTTLIKPVLDVFVKPKLIKLKTILLEKNQENKVIHFDITDSEFEKYLNRNFNKIVYLNTLVFPNQQINLLELYHPLTLNKDFLIKKVQRKNLKVQDESLLDKEIEDKTEKFLIDDKINLNFIESHRRLLIRDRAGMGKSTMMKYLNFQVLAKEIGIPIFIELRRLSDKNDILNEILSLINGDSCSFNKIFISKLLELGEFVFFLDGFDEIKSESKETITNNIQRFIAENENNIFIISSRPEDSLYSFGNFQLFSIEPLTKPDYENLLRKYDFIGGSSIADKIINDLKTSNKEIQNFLGNPFLVSLLYRSYNFNNHIPSKRSTFYDELYMALFKSHDLSKNAFKRPKLSDLDVLDFRLILRDFAFHSSLNGEIEYTYSDLSSYITQAKERIDNLTFKTSHYIEDLETNVPLLVKEGVNYRWSHKSIQDFFTAEFIDSDTNKVEILETIFESFDSNFLNILYFYFELDYKTFKNVIIKNVVQLLVDGFQNTNHMVNEYDETNLRIWQFAQNSRTLTQITGIIELLIEKEVFYNLVKVNPIYNLSLKEFPRIENCRQILEEIDNQKSKRFKIKELIKKRKST